MPAQLIEGAFFPLGDDVTEARLQEWFAAFVDGSGEFPPNPPIDVNLGRGTLPLSPGQSTVVSVPLEAGRYVLIDWLKDADTGTRMVKQGHYLIVTVT